MRSSLAAALFALFTITANQCAFAGANEGRVAEGYSSQVGIGRTVTYEVSLSKLKDSGSNPVRVASVQRMTLTTAMHASATARSLTQTAYPCLDQDTGKRLTRCSVEDGFSLVLTPHPAGAVSPRIVTEVNLHVIDLLGLKDGDTPLGAVQYPSIRLEKYTQDLVLTPGEAIQVATGSYVLDVRVKSVE